jgi:alkylation response protein AidB-like acyl-CoA dehydrogenase
MLGANLEAPLTQDYNAQTDDAFRTDVRTFFETEYPEHLRYILRRARWDEMKAWWATLYKKGWVAPGWPVAWGGMGLDASKMLIYFEEMERHGVARPPDQGITHIGPILMHFGTEEQKNFYLPRALSGEHIWCQGYSEPNSGSDLASLRTTAVPDGDDYVINGQKIWTSLAQDATHCYVLTRTNPDVKKQEGISLFLVDFKTPGITLRPIVNLAGHAEFCQVFYDNVRVPRANLVGALNKGWTVAKALLGFERLAIGSPRRPAYALQRLRMVAQARGLFADQGFMDRYTALKLDIDDLGSLYGRFIEQAKRGDQVGPDVSMLKIWSQETWQRLSELLIETGAEEAVLDGVQNFGSADNPVEVDVMTTFYMSRPGTIAGGSSEVQRNIMSRYVLGLPV